MRDRSILSILARAAWFVGCFGGWVIVRTLVQIAVGRLLDKTMVDFVVLEAVGAMITLGLAWALAHVALRLGAPAAIWISVAGASIPFALIAALGLYSGSDLSWVIAEAFQAIAPPLAFFLEARRQPARPTSPAQSLANPADLSGGS